MRGAPLIDGIRTRAYTIPTDAPEADGTITWTSTTMVLVEVRSGTTVGTGWTYGPPACSTVVSDALGPLITGGSALEIGDHATTMARAVRNSGRQGIAACAISAVDLALWDLKARLLELPLAHLLGGSCRPVDVYGSGGFTTYSKRQLSDQLSGWVHDERIPRVKIKIGESWGAEMQRDLTRIHQAREIIGPDAELFVDANGGYRRKQAIRVMSACRDDRVTWFEEPVSSDDLDGLREVRDAVEADVTAGEYGYDLAYFQHMARSGAVDCLQIDVTRCGGISVWQSAAAVAASMNLDVSAHCSPHAHAHVAAATANLRHIEWFHDHTRIESMLFDGTLSPTGGAIRPAPDAVGNGLTFREEDAERYRVA